MRLRFICLLTLLVCTRSLIAGSPTTPFDKQADTSTDWLTGENVNLGGILSPHFHALGAYGKSSGDPSQLQLGSHDPHRDGWTTQALEFGLSARMGPLEAFANYAGGWDHDWRWEGEWEEYFGKLRYEDLGLEFRGGRFLNRLGLHNSLHAHGWDTVDQNLVHGRFLGEEGLGMTGGEITWKLPTPVTTLLSLGAGEAFAHDHEHDHEAESLFEAEGPAYNNFALASNLTSVYEVNDFIQHRAGISFVTGDNAFGRTTQSYGLHYQFQWRENGWEVGGQSFRWTNELWLRRFGAVSGRLEDEHKDDEEEGPTMRRHFDDLGLYSQVLYGFDDRFFLGLRAEYISGLSDLGQEERFRLSPSATWFFNRSRTLFLRLQYNFDHGSRSGEEHSVWAQVGFNWGGPEVR